MYCKDAVLFHTSDNTTLKLSTIVVNVIIPLKKRKKINIYSRSVVCQTKEISFPEAL